MLTGRLISLVDGLTERKALLICFSTGLLLRLIPEVLAYPWPVGWDTLDYVYLMRTGVVWSHWTRFFTYTWLLNSILVPVHSLLGVNPFLLLKIVAPILFGLNVCGVYWFARSLLNWGVKISLFAGGFFSLQLASLRISIDLLRNTLGLGLLLFALPLMRKLDSKRSFAAFMVVSLLAVFAHEYAAVTLLVISLTLAVSAFFREDEAWRRVSKKLVAAILPAFLVFVTGLYFRMFPVSYESGPVVGPNMVWAKDAARQSYGQLFFMVNYIGMNTGLDNYPNYLFLVLGVATLFAVLYLSYFYLVLKGFFKNRVLDVWTGLLLAGSFGCLVTPFFALQYWHRWMFMLVYPFTLYAVEGAKPVLKKAWKSVHNGGLGLRVKNRVSVTVLTTVLLGFLFLATPSMMAAIGFGFPPVYPACMYFSFAPTVPFRDVDGTIQASEWLSSNLDNGSCAVLHDAFATWAMLYLDGSQDVIAFRNDVDLAVDLALDGGYQHVYFVCWNQYIVWEGLNWYGLHVPEGFSELESFDRISIYELVSSGS